MNLLLIRDQCRATCTIGKLHVDGDFMCYTMEDVVRPPGEKVYGKTAIPYGEYEVLITWSPRFRRELPLVASVPGFAGIRFHPGNTAEDTEGCILPGLGVSGDMVTQSRIAFDRLFDAMKKAKARGESITLSIFEGGA